MVDKNALPDENDMAKAYNTISEARDFLEEVVCFGSRKLAAGLPKKCPICGCEKGYGHSPKCELHRMELRAHPLSGDLQSALVMFGRVEAIRLEQLEAAEKA